MNLPNSPRVAFCKHDDRNIVDPTQWESTEVGGAEALAFNPKKVVKRSKVSSMRSSLFQKNVKKISQNDPNHNTFHCNLVFPSSAIESDAFRSMKFAFEENSPQRALDFCDYGKPNRKAWTKDVFAFFHNPVRCEMRDLACMLRSLHAIGPKLTVGHFVKLRVWWHTCSSLLLDYLDMEVKYLEPWIAIALDDNHDGDIKEAMKLFQAMPNRQEALRKMFINIAKAFGDLCDPPSIQKDALTDASSTANSNASPVSTRSASQKTLIVLGSLDACIVEMTKYVTDQETMFTPLLHDAYKSEKKDREVLMSKGVKHFVKKARKRDFMLVLLTRWMDDQKMIKAHVKMIQEWHECTYGTLVVQFENNHGNLVEQFKDDTAC